MLLSDVSLSIAYTGPKTRIERYRKTKISTEVAHVARDSDTTFKVKGQGHQAALLIAMLTRQAAAAVAWKRIGRGKLLLRCGRLGGATRFGAHRGRRGAGAYRAGRPPTACYCRVYQPTVGTLTTRLWNGLHPPRSLAHRYEPTESTRLRFDGRSWCVGLLIKGH